MFLRTWFCKHTDYNFLFFRKKKQNFCGWVSTPPLLQEMRGRHGLTLPSATPLRHARNQSKYLRPSLRSQPFCSPRQPLINCPCRWDSRGSATGRTGTPLPSGRGMRWENLPEIRARHRHRTKLGVPASIPWSPAQARLSYSFIFDAPCWAQRYTSSLT